jgi:uncharacterized membrane protein
MPTPRSSFGERKSVRAKPAAAMIVLFFFGTTDETTIVSTFRLRKILRIVAVVSFLVG